MEERHLKKAEALLLLIALITGIILRNNFSSGFALGTLLMWINYSGFKVVLGREKVIRGLILFFKTAFSLIFIYLVVKYKKELIVPFVIGTGTFPVLLAINVLILYFMKPDGTEGT